MATDDVLIVAVIGCGRMGAFTRPELRARIGAQWLPLNHAEGVLATEGLRLVACCDIDETAALRAAERYGMPAAFTNLQEMLKSVRPDIVTIATRTPTRTDIIEAVCAAGVKGIYAEKPLSQNVASARHCAAVMDACGVAFSYGTQRRYMPIFRQARDIVASGELGDIVKIEVHHGRGALLWSHPHAVDILSFFASDRPIDLVQADLTIPEGSVRPNLIDADPIVNRATMTFREGPTGVITSNTGMSVVISATGGILAVRDDGTWLEERPTRAPGTARPGGPKVIEPRGPITSGLVVALSELRDAIRLGTPPSLTPSQVAEQQAALFGFAASHLAGGTQVRPDAVEPDLTITGRKNGLAA